MSILNLENFLIIFVRRLIMTVFDYVKILADAQNITISRLEKECGLGNATIKAWEKSYPKIDKLYKVSSFFDVIYYLLSTFI